MKTKNVFVVIREEMKEGKKTFTTNEAVFSTFEKAKEYVTYLADIFGGEYLPKDWVTIWHCGAITNYSRIEMLELDHEFGK